MKKGLAITLGTLVFALAGSLSFAKAPVFSGIPDVVIGDQDDTTQQGTTVDQNFFRYLNAFNILSYVRDDDSTSADLRFVFLEPTTWNDVQINGKNQLDLASASTADPTTWSAAEFTGAASHPQRSFLLSFRDLVRSPAGSNPPFANPARADGSLVTSGTVELLPWHATTGTALSGAANGRAIALYASDLDNVTSKALVIFSLNTGNDALSGGITTVFAKGSLPSLWTYSQASPNLPQATSGSGTGFLSLSAGLTATGSASYNNKYFARFEITRNPTSVAGFTMGKIGHQPGTLIYAARYTLAQNQADRRVAPQIRLGVFNDTNSFQIQELITPLNAATATIDAHNPQIPAANTPRLYPVFWSSNDQTPNFNNLANVTQLGGADMRNWSAFFDMLDADNTQQGTWTLSDFDVVTIPRPADQATAANITDFSNANSWTTEANQGAVTFTATAGQPLQFADSGGAGATNPATAQFLLRSRNNTVNWAAGTLVRTKAYVACPTTTDRNQFHRFRVRHRAFFGNMAHEFFLRNNSAVFSQVGYPILPVVSTSAATAYEIYVPTNGGASAELIALGGGAFQLGIDQLHLVDDTGVKDLATNTTVRQVTEELLPEPTLQ